jgi:hypothetical protein
MASVLAVFGQKFGAYPTKKQAVFVVSALIIVASAPEIVGSFPATTRLCGTSLSYIV